MRTNRATKKRARFAAVGKLRCSSASRIARDSGWQSALVAIVQAALWPPPWLDGAVVYNYGRSPTEILDRSDMNPTRDRILLAWIR